MLVYQDESLVPTGYTDSDFQSDIESKKSTSGYVFTLGGEVPVGSRRGTFSAVGYYTLL